MLIVDQGVYLEHFGVKGMRWGVRNEREPSVYRLQSASPKIDPTLHRSTQAAGKDVAALMSERYGFHISEISSIPVDRPEHSDNTLAFVKSTPGQSGGVVYVRQEDLSKRLKGAEEIGWFGKNTGNVHGLLTHESAHALFHAEQQMKPGFFKARVVGGNIKARDKALKAALQEAKKHGISDLQFTSKLSGYAASSGMQEEVEAELFSQYHWRPNPPSFVKVWGQTLHHEMGINDTPFRERTVPHG